MKKKYEKPLFEIVALHLEERLASCYEIWKLEIGTNCRKEYEKTLNS